MHRGLTSGREDDNMESIKKRFSKFLDNCFLHLCLTSLLDTYREQTKPVIDHYAALGKVAEVSFVPLVNQTLI